mmetsp:Transcript_77175/g.221800  ORF Transcript_77175/g.221800 Transcript_77175/m.221800 type:complete len:356 (+) Transcript_77175:82-1149(+)
MRLRISHLSPLFFSVGSPHPSPHRAAMASITTMKDSLAEVSQTGAFVRTDSEFRATSLPSVEPEDLSSRYHLYVSNACPWAHRALIVRKLKGLEGAVGLSVVHPTWGQTRPDKDEHKGWIFRSEDDASVVPPCGVGSIANAGVIPDVVNQAPDVRALYEIAGAGAANKFTVPILWDKADSTIINNESSEIIRLMNTEFNAVATNPDLDLYPEHLRAEIDAVNEWIYPNINNGEHAAHSNVRARARARAQWTRLADCEVLCLGRFTTQPQPFRNLNHRGLPLRLCQVAGRVRRGGGGPLRRARSSRRDPLEAALPHGRHLHRGRYPPIRDPHSIRRGLRRLLQVQRQVRPRILEHP